MDSPYSDDQVGSGFRHFVGGVEHTEQLGDPADEQALVIDINPGAGLGRKDHVVAGLDWHPHPCGLPPVDALADRQNDAVLGWRLGGAGRNDEAGLAHHSRLELLDHNPVKEGFHLVLGHGFRLCDRCEHWRLT